MNIWPFNRPSPNLQIRRNRQAIDGLELELVELRELLEKIMAAVKRIQGKTYRRKRAEMELDPPPAEDGIHPTPTVPVGAVPAPQPPYGQPIDFKAELRRRAASLRGR